MTRRSKIWLVVAAVFSIIFSIINAGGAGYAFARGEWLHGGLHVALLLGTYMVWRVVPWTGRQELPRAQQADERLEYLQQSVDAIALEVERVGEAQRFSDKLRAERDKPTPPNKQQ